MALKVWKDEHKVTAIRTELGRIVGDGTLATVSCATPDHVRRYTAAEPFGKLLVSTAQYTYDAGLLTVATAPETDEVVVAFSAGEYIFQGQDAQGNDQAELGRTLEQKLYVESDGADAVGATISFGDYSPGGGLSVSHHYLSLDSGGTAVKYLSGGSPLSIGTITAGSIVPFWCKSVVPLNTPLLNYNDIYLSCYSKNYSTEP